MQYDDASIRASLRMREVVISTHSSNGHSLHPDQAVSTRALVVIDMLSALQISRWKGWWC